MKLPVVKTRIQTRYSDTDALGHISSGSYFQFIEVARAEFFIEAGKSGELPVTVVVNINIDYLGEALYGDDISVVTWCSKLGSKSIVVNSDIYAGDKLSARGTVTSVGFDMETRESCSLPASWEVSEYTGVS